MVSTTDRALASAADRLEKFVRDIGQVSDDDTDFDRQVHLFDAGYVDSLGAIELIAHVESNFGIELTEEDLFDPRFSSIDGITAVAGERLAADAATNPTAHR
jgi:acyl carrier protein